MKNTISHWTSVVLAGAALLLSSCSKDEGTDEGGSATPVFPDLVTKTILEGESSCEVTFTPNMDWTVSIPTDDNEIVEWFKLSDGVMPDYSISGKASATPVTIQVLAIKSAVFDESPVCEVSLTMGGETRVIAKVTRSNKARQFAIYASGYTEENGFSYEFGDTPLTKYEGSETPSTAPDGAPEFQWPIGTTGFMQVIKVESNFEWVVSTPSWISYAERGSDTDTYFINVDIDKITENEINGAVALLDFYDKTIDPSSETGNSAHNRYCFKLPSINDLVRHPAANIDATFNFNAAGEYVTEGLDGGVSSSTEYATTISSTKGLQFYAAEFKDGKYTPIVGINSWVSVTIEGDDTENGWNSDGALFQEYGYTIKVDPNENEAREAKLIALPKSMIPQNPYNDIYTEDKTDFKEEYKAYVFATIKQEGQGGGEVPSDEFININPAVIDRFEGENAIASLKKLDPNSEDDAQFFWDHMNDSHIFNYAEPWMSGTPVYVLTCTENLMKDEDISGSNPIGTLLVSPTYDKIMIDPNDTSWLICEEGSTDNDKIQLLISTGDENAAKNGSSAALVFQTVRVIDGVEYPMGTVGVVFIIRDYGTASSGGDGGDGTGEGGETPEN